MWRTNILWIIVGHVCVCLCLPASAEEEVVGLQPEKSHGITFDDVINWFNDNKDSHDRAFIINKLITDSTGDESELSELAKNKRNSNYNQVSTEHKSADFLRLETRVSRLEHQLASQGHTLAGHWERLAAQHGLLLRQAETGEQYLTKLSHLDTEVDIQKGRIDRVMIDNHWQEVKLKVMDNNTVALRQGIRQMDTTIQALYADHGFFYKQIEQLTKDLLDTKLALKRAESRTNLLENSLRYLVYMRSEPSINESFVEDSVKWLKIKPVGETRREEPRMFSMIWEQDSFAKMSEMNKTLSKLAQRSTLHQQQLDGMSLDLEQLKDEVFTFYKYLEATQDRLRDLKPNNMTHRKGGAQALSEHTVRFLMGKVEELQKEVGNLKQVFQERTGIDLRTLGTDLTMTNTPISDSLVLVRQGEQDNNIEKIEKITPKHIAEDVTTPYMTKVKESRYRTYGTSPTTPMYVGDLEEELDATRSKDDKHSNEAHLASILPGKGSQEVGRNLKGANQKGVDLLKGRSRSKGRHKVRHLSNASMPPQYQTSSKVPTTWIPTAKPNYIPMLKGPSPNYKVNKGPKGPGTEDTASEENTTERKVKAKTKTKTDKMSKGTSTGWSAEMLNVHPNDQDVCSMWGLRIGAPRIVARMPKALTGTWMRDSRARDDLIYVLKDNLKVNNIRQFQNESMLEAGNVSTVYKMPFRCTGTGHVVYNGSLYCNKYMGDRLMKYDLGTQQVTSRRLKGAGYNNTYPYAINAYTDMDFAVDEVGLWLIYSSTGDITIAKINPNTLETQQVWVTDYSKVEALNSFMICGRLYVVGFESYETGVVYVYDTRSRKGRHISVFKIPIQMSSDYMTMLDYNPKDAKLYGWQMSKDWEGEMVLYDVYFKDNLL